MLSTQRQSYTCLLIILLLGLTSCMGGGRAPVHSRGDQQSSSVDKKPVAEKSIPGSAESAKITDPIMRRDFYKVVRGDTLYSIAWRYKLDYKKLARWNAIPSPYVIHIGKKLRLTSPPEEPDQVATKTKNPGPYPKPAPVTKKLVPKPALEVKQVPTTKPTAKLPAKIKSWQWPTKGKLISSNTVSSRNGIDIKGKMGQTVKAAAAGNVVYSGQGLVGYGNLIIIKHNKTFLSAYAHNSRLLVNEGAKVSAGQPIAEMGNSGTNMVKLHFEIRKNGKSVDPLKYLSK